MNAAVDAIEFFRLWKVVCEPRSSKLLALWDRRREYTSEIFDRDDSIVSVLSMQMGLKAHNNYYSIDTIFFDEVQDRVHCAPLGQTWVHNIKIAFEHEHVFPIGLFQEVSHLLITRADLRVLVSYPNNKDELQAELVNLGKVISDSDMGKSNPNFLLITGQRDNLKTRIEWSAFSFQDGALLPLKTGDLIA
jgi:hypothetical protein